MMSLYKLYVESGPRRKRTMVHVLELLGCIASGPTTEEALARTPAAIDNFRRFLSRYGAVVDVDAGITIEIASHITEGIWLGNGDPSLVFEPDLLPLTAQEGELFIQRLEWMWAEIITLVGELNEAQLDEQPLTKGRSIREMLEHILESEYFYLVAFGRLEGLPGSGSIVKKKEGTLLSWMVYVQSVEYARLRSLTMKERSEPILYGKDTWTTRKVVRRMLEHRWEHLVELHERLGPTP